MKKILKIILSPFLGKKSFQGVFKWMHLLSLKGMNFGGGVDPKDSGEDCVINYVFNQLSNKELIVFDVGANKGDYTELWLKKKVEWSRSIKIFSFEPAKSVFEVLKQKFSSEQTVKLSNIALSDSNGQATLYSDFAGSGLGSLAKRNVDFAGIEFKQSENIQTQTLEAFCSELNIQSIDFLKLDVEGFELAVLKGGANLIRNKKIKFIQFEFGGADIDTKVFFKDFFNLLSEHYQLYRILKDGLEPIKQYKETDEVFITTNYLAKLK